MTINKRRTDKSQSEYESRSINRREYLDFMKGAYLCPVTDRIQIS